MQTLTRRGLLVLGGTGAAGAVLAACGETDDRRDQGDDAELLAAALAAETALADAYAGAGGAQPPVDERELLGTYRDASNARIDELTTLTEDAGGETTGSASAADGVPGAAEGAIAAYRAAAGPLSTPELRATAISFLVAVAAELATLVELEGGDAAPEAFVTGGAETPYEASEEDGEE